MPAYASGKRAYGICDRTGFRYKLEDLVFEVQHGVKTGLRVGKDVLDPDQPQNFLGNINTSDPQSLLNPRPDVNPGRGLFVWLEPRLESPAIYGRVRRNAHCNNN